MGYIFISYAREDEAWAARLASVLEARGWSVWWDRKIDPGEVWDTTIEEKLKNAHCQVVLWSAVSVTSDWVKNEARRGKSRKVLVPVWIADVDCPLEFDHLHGTKLVDWDSATPHHGFETLVGKIARLMNAAPSIGGGSADAGFGVNPGVAPDAGARRAVTATTDTPGKTGKRERFSPRSARVVLGGVILLCLVLFGAYRTWWKDGKGGPGSELVEVVTGPARNVTATGSAFGTKLANVAKEQYQRYNAKVETDAELAAQIQVYWEAIGLAFPGNETPWSAVFVSYCVKQAGAAPGDFRYSAISAAFVQQAAENTASDTGTFRAIRISESPVQVGDIIQMNRGGGGIIRFEDLRKEKDYVSHTAIVVSLAEDDTGRFALAVGGNQNNSIRSSVIRLDAGGKIIQKSMNPYICIVRNVETQTPSKTSSDDPIQERQDNVHSENAKILDALKELLK